MAAQSRLLALPAELRNRIYEYALLQDGGIRVMPRLSQPSLLLTSRQICQESLQIWYNRNDFEVPVRDCDASLLTKWGRHAKDKAPRGRKPVLVMSGVPH